MKKRNLVQKISELSLVDYFQIMEAMGYLVASNVLIYLFPLRWWNHWIGEKNGFAEEIELPAEQLEKVSQVKHNARRGNKILFSASRCFANALTIKKMLQKRGIPATLFLGVQKDEARNLKAHAWVKSGDRIVYGGRHAELRFQQLIGFA